MNTKNFLICGIAGGVAEFLLGWLFYGILFKSIFPSGEGENFLLITLGCFVYGFLIAYILTAVSQIKSIAAGLKIGAVLGLFIGLYGSFFNYGMAETVDYQLFLLDVLIMLISTALIGVVIAAINKKLG